MCQNLLQPCVAGSRLAAIRRPVNVSLLYVIQGRNRGTRYDLTAHSGAVSIGREAGNTVQLDDNEVSRRHAEIRRVGESFTVADLKSSNGTFVNSRRIERADLRSGDQIHVGRSVLAFALEPADLPLSTDVDIVASAPRDDGSRIVRTMRDEALFGPMGQTVPEDTDNRWLARARSNLQVMYRTALAVSHTLDIDELLNRILQLVFVELFFADTLTPMVVVAGSGTMVIDRVGISPISQLALLFKPDQYPQLKSLIPCMHLFVHVSNSDNNYSVMQGEALFNLEVKR